MASGLWVAVTNGAYHGIMGSPMDSMQIPYTNSFFMRISRILDQLAR